MSKGAIHMKDRSQKQMIVLEKQQIIQQLLNMNIYKSLDDRQLYELTVEELADEWNKHVRKSSC